MPGIVPLVLPLSILLASIMTFGDLSEHYEFAAMKSAGISLQRAMKGLTIFILLLSLAAFTFANNVIPYSQYKFINFRKNIAQMTPSMAIVEGQFSKVGNFSIKVDKKLGEKGNILKGVVIHKKSNDGLMNVMVLKAKSGELISSPTSNILELVLFDGYQYEDIIPNNYEERKKNPFSKTTFKKYTVYVDLTKLTKSGNQTATFSGNTNTMLSVGELKYTLDSLNQSFKKDAVSFAENIHSRNNISEMGKSVTELKDSLTKKTPVANSVPKDLLQNYNNSEKQHFLEIAKNNATNTNFTISIAKDDFLTKQKNINGHWLALFDKFVVAYACILMFFIGAPLGAIIRKGGLGLPIVFAMLIFITFHFANTFGKKMAQEAGITAFMGSWMSSLILTPLALTLTYRASKDLGLFDLDFLLVPIQKAFKKFFSKKTEPEEDVNE